MRKTLLTLTIAGMSLLNSNCNKHKNYKVIERDGDIIFYNLTYVKRNKYEIIEYRNFKDLNEKYPRLNAKQTIYYDFLDEFGKDKPVEFKIDKKEYLNPNENMYRILKKRLEKLKKDLQ